jgi:hypothetical protein
MPILPLRLNCCQVLLYDQMIRKGAHFGGEGQLADGEQNDHLRRDYMNIVHWG